MARAGLCSRRDAERWIAEGRVRVNGQILKTPAVVVQDGDQIIVDGKPLQTAEKTRLYMYHKPEGLVTTAKDEMGRQTVFDALPKEMGRVVSVGRLDLNTEGLLLLTNDGGLSRFMELPSTGWRRRYRVRVHGRPDERRLQALEKGITIEGIHYKSIEAVLENQTGANAWLNVVITEGKNREVRKIMEALDLRVNRLIRVAYGPFQLGDLPKGAVIEVKQKVLHEQLAGYFKNKK